MVDIDVRGLMLKMNDEKKAERIIEKTAGADDEAGNKSSANSIVERADASAERLAKENERYEANIRRQEELMAKQTLGGRSEYVKPEPKKELAGKELINEFMKGNIKAPF